MPGRNSYFRRFRNNSEPNPLLDLVGFKGSNRTPEETSVRNMRQTIARCMDQQGIEIDMIADLLGKEAEISIPSLASVKSAAIAGLKMVANSRSAKAIQDAVDAMGAPSVQELHLLPFDEGLDGEFSYKATEGDTEYYVVTRRAWLNPKTGRPATPANGQVCRVILGVGDDPQSRANNRGPTGQQIRHQNWRKTVIADGLAVSASVVNTFRITGVNHVLASTGSRTEAEIVFYVEGYSFWSVGDSKLLAENPAMNGEESTSDADTGMDSGTIHVGADFGDDDGDPLD